MALLGGVVGCAPALKEYYPDEYFAQDRIYSNRSLGFALAFNGAWEILTDAAQMSKAGRTVARQLQKQRQELLFVGSTTEGTQGTRAIAANANLDNKEYLRQVREANKELLEQDLGDKRFSTPEFSMIQWQYRYKGLHFVEFLFRSGSYNMRIAFWTTPALFERFLPLYEQMMMSVTAVGRI
jgi:hypothetical protein